MIVFMRSTIGLTQSERMELSQRATSRIGRADDGRRARLILLLEAGHTWAQIRDKLDCNDAFIARWNKRFGRERLAGLFSRHAGHGPSKLTPALEARILDWTLKRKPADGSTHWSTRKLGSALSISHMMVARVWATCQTASNRDPGSACKRDPSLASGQACPGSEQEGPALVAQCLHERRCGARGWCLFAHWGKPGWHSGAVFKAPALVAGFDDFAMMGQAV